MRPLLLLMLLIAAVPTFSQESDLPNETDNQYKFNKKDWSLEIGFDPRAIFNSSSTDEFLYLPGGMFRARKFIGDQLAVRLTSAVGFDYQDVEDEFTSNTWSFSIGSGIEKHLGQNRRLSPYLGTSVSFDIGGTMLDQGSEGQTRTTKNHGFTVGAVAGVDYYFVKRAYLGIEFGYDIRYQSQRTEWIDNRFDIVDLEFREDLFTIGEDIIPAFRLGFLL